ncbi:MAG TPA: hypothetical protein ENI76_09370 [Ignavibacteria bacterium]|nr:hypothetical protein [Ignavibacteria bacterium]
MSTCWICGGKAETGEHRNKKTDIELIFGKGSYKENRIIKREFGSEQKEIIQGPKSDALKYEHNLCQSCNGAKTQPFDRAYEAFMNHIKDNFDEIKSSKIINCSNIYGNKNRKSHQEHLFKYFIKSLGCRIDSIGHTVPKVFVNAMNGHNYGKLLKVTFQLNQNFEPAVGEYAFHGDIDANKEPLNYFWGQYAGWVSVYYACNRNMPNELGTTWYGKSKSIHCEIYNG